MTSTLKMYSHSPEETQKIGMTLGRHAYPGDLFLLTGGLGVGKTCLTQGIAWGLGIKEHARSPTFVLMSQYHGRLALYHIDLYRLDDIEEVLDLGLDEYLLGQGVCVVEWAEKALQAFPQEHMLIQLEYLGEGERRLTLKAHGPRYQRLLQELGIQPQE